jgi:hypothetical protein
MPVNETSVSKSGRATCWDMNGQKLPDVRAMFTVFPAPPRYINQ